MRRPFLSLLFFSYQEDPNAPLINSVIILRCINARAFSILANELELCWIKYRFASAHHLIPCCISPHMQEICCYSTILIFQCVMYIFLYSSAFIYITTHHANTHWALHVHHVNLYDFSRYVNALIPVRRYNVIYSSPRSSDYKVCNPFMVHLAYAHIFMLSTVRAARKEYRSWYSQQISTRGYILIYV